MFGPKVSEWRALAEALSLTPYRPTATHTFGATFRQVKRTLGVPSDGMSFQHPLYGVRNGVEILVHTFDVGGGSNTTSYTGVLARIDPPLFLGLGLRAKGFLENVFGTPQVALGHPADKKLYVDGWAPENIRVLMTPQLVEHAIALLPFYLHVSDSTVLVAREGTLVDAPLIASFADHAASLARELVASRRLVPETTEESALHGEWERYAEANAFTYDRARTRLEGTVSGTRVEVALESAGKSVATAVSAIFPQHVDVAFAILKTWMPGFLQGMFGEDIVVGHRSFDEMYKVTGFPKERVRELFQREGLPDLLAALAAASSDVEMNHAQLYARLPHGIQTGKHLSSAVELVRAVSEALFREARATVGPYR